VSTDGKADYHQEVNSVGSIPERDLRARAAARTNDCSPVPMGKSPRPMIASPRLDRLHFAKSKIM